MINTLKQRWVLSLLVVLGILPWVMIAVAGFFWLWQENLLLTWLSVALVTVCFCWLAARQFRAHVARPPVPSELETQPSSRWSITQREAWESVEHICKQLEDQAPELEDWDTYRNLFIRTVETVAAHFYPGQEHAFLEMRVPDFLRIIELLSNDLRELTTENIPGSHIVTINDVIKGHRLAAQLKKVYNWYRIASFAIAPATAVFNEVRNRITGDTTSLIWREMKLYLTCACVRKAGFYAIQLYSGELDFGAEQYRSFVTSESVSDRDTNQDWDKEVSKEPMRIVVIGQTNSGKSSLINALFGAVKTVADAVPVTRHVQPFVLEKDGFPQAIIFDTGGYEDSTGAAMEIAEIEQSMDKSDLIILVCAANQAAREPDRRMLVALGQRCRQRKTDSPALIVAMSHIDRLRPKREWKPPYCLNPPSGSKAAQIAAASECVTADLGVNVDQVVPLNLRDGYNVDDGLIPAILRQLPAANRSQYLRCLKSFHDENYWAHIWKQSKSAGLFLAAVGSGWVKAQWKK